MPTKNYALEWYGYGLDENNEFVIKFMMHWIAFNWLYNGSGKGPERDRIIAFCLKDENFERLSRYDPFDTEEFKTLSGDEVRNVRPAQEAKLARNVKPKRRARRRSPTYSELIHRNLREATGKIRVVNLLLAIYQVRCNLFHGSKSLENSRDLELVYASSIIMEGYMTAYLRNDHLPS